MNKKTSQKIFISFLLLGIIISSFLFFGKFLYAANSNCTSECSHGYTPECCLCLKETPSGAPIACYINKTIEILLNSVLGLLFALMFVTFVYGLLEYIRSGGDEQKRKKGIQYIIWGIIGLFVAFSVWGLVNLLRGTFSLKETQPEVPTIKLNY